MTNRDNGPTFQQWVGLYETTTSFEATSFSPLELRADGTLLISGREVDYTFNGDDSSISAAQFTLEEAHRTLTVPKTEITFGHQDGCAVFTGNIQANPAEGVQKYTGKQKSRELVIPAFISDVKMSMALYHNDLHVVGAVRIDPYRTHLIVHRKFPLHLLNTEEGDETQWSAAALSDPKHWSKELWQPEVWPAVPALAPDFKPSSVHWFRVGGNTPDYYASSPRNESGYLTNADITSLVSIGDALYCFYTYSDTAEMSLRARKFTVNDNAKTGQWGEGIILCEPQDDSGQAKLLCHTGAVSAVPFGTTQILVAACGTGDTRTGDNYGPGYGNLMFYLFDISDLNNANDGKGWAALSRRWIDVNTEVDFFLGKQEWPLENRSGAGYTIDADWILTTKPGSEPDTDTLVPEYHLAISFGISTSDPAKNQHVNFTWQSHIPLAFDESTTDAAGAGKLKDNPWGKGRITAFSNQDGKRSSLKKDASGRLQSFTDFQQKSFAPGYTRTNEAPSRINRWGEQGPTNKIDYYGTDDYTKPFNLFYTYLPGKKTVETPGVNLEGKPAKFNATEYPILEFICYGQDKIQLHDYGSIRMVSDKHDIKQKDSMRPVYQIGGYFDGPVPFPVQNYAGVKNLTGNTAQVAAFEYGQSEKDEIKNSTESTWSIGLESELKWTKGLGLGFKASYEYEDITKDEKEVVSELEKTLTVDAKVRNPEPYKDPEAEGTGIARALSAQFYVSGFQFVDRWGSITSDGLSKDPADSPKLGRVLARMQSAPGQGTVAFESTLFTPGELESYTAEAIDAKMGENYVRDTICKNAYVFEGDQPYLEYTWNHGNPEVETARQMTKSFTAHEWSHGGKLYAGLAGGEEVSIFGFGQEVEFSVLAGGGYKREWSSEALKEVAWTIGAEAKDFNIPMPLEADEGGDPNGVVEYSFRAYFLPVPSKPSTLPPNQWAMELKDRLPDKEHGDFKFTKDRIDTGFGCWRIFFLVTSIQYRKGASKPDYTLPSDLDDVTSVYANQD